MDRLCRCGAIVDGSCPRCDSSRRKVGEQSACKRGYDRQWRKLRERKIADQPMCEDCLEQDRVRAAEEVHHIKPIATHPELRLVFSNLRSLCIPCHAKY